MHRSPFPRRLLTALGLAVGSAASCDSTGGTGPLPDGGVRVLFVGNSLTYENDLPRTIAAMAKAVNDTPLVYRTIAHPNFAIEDHYLNGIESNIAANGWHFVVMQQGPSTTVASSEHLTAWTGVVNDFVVAAGARTAMYSVWPGGHDPQLFDLVRENYLKAAVAVDGMFIPAGDGWREAWQRDPSLDFYASDEFHPSRLGTYVAALVHFEMLYDRPATDLPDVATVDGRKLDLPPATVAMLQESAHAAVLAWGRR